jgi:hypothetical protein
VGKRHRRIRAHSTPGPVAGAATEKSGSKPIAQITACPACVPQKSPCPGQPNLSPDPDITLRATVSCPETELSPGHTGGTCCGRIPAGDVDTSRVSLSGCLRERRPSPGGLLRLVSRGHLRLDLRDARKQAWKRSSAVSLFASPMLVRRDGMSVLLKLF